MTTRRQTLQLMAGADNVEALHAPGMRSFQLTYNFRNVLQVLEKRGWSEQNLELLLGQNWLRLFKETIG